MWLDRGWTVVDVVRYRCRSVTELLVECSKNNTAAQFEIRYRFISVGFSYHGPCLPAHLEPESVEHLYKTHAAVPKPGVFCRIPFLCKRRGFSIAKEKDDVMRLTHPTLDHVA